MDSSSVFFIHVSMQDLLFGHRACHLPGYVLEDQEDAWEVAAKASSSENILDMPSRSISRMPRYFHGTFPATFLSPRFSLETCCRLPLNHLIL